VSFLALWKSFWNRKERAPAPLLRRGTFGSAQPAPPAAVEPRMAPTEKRPMLPRFHTTAGDHVQGRQVDPHTRRRIRLRNAFTPSHPVIDPSMFAGRTATLESMIRAVEDQRSHLIIYGERGVGKTSLLHMLARAAREARYIVVYFSCGASSDFSETFRFAAADIPIIYHSGVSPISTTSDAGSSLLDLLQPGKLSPRQFADASAKLVGTRVLVILDEFDRAESVEFRRDVAELIKTLSDLSARLQLVIGGVAADLVDLMQHLPSIRRSISSLRIAAMSDEEVRTLVANGERSSGLTFEPEAVEIVVSAARGSPYLTSLLCHTGGLRALGDGKLIVSANHISDALDEATEDLLKRLPDEILPHLKHFADLAASNAAASKNGDAVPGDLAPTGDGLGVDSRYARVLNKLQEEGLIRDGSPARYATISESLEPYLHLLRARELSRSRVSPASAEGAGARQARTAP
jgi:archaellum biogenesis ATPase FlaH